MNINIKTIPHHLQRYDTCGDWYREGEVTNIRISKLPDWRYEFLIAFHELVEYAMCSFLKISEEEVTRYDLLFRKQQDKGEIPKDEEPGDDPGAPYHTPHFVAEAVERIVAFGLGVKWGDYGQAVLALDYRDGKPLQEELHG